MNIIKRILKEQSKVEKTLTVYFSKLFGLSILYINIENITYLNENQSDCDGDDDRINIKLCINIIENKDKEKLINFLKKKSNCFEIFDIIIKYDSLDDLETY